MAHATEWLITSAECVVAKRRISAHPDTQPPGEPVRPTRRPERERNPAPGYGGDRRLPEEDPGGEPATPTDDDDEQPVGVPV